jgi:hypothetical protein
MEKQMRKLKPLEIFALTALMSLGGNADAQDAEETLPNTLNNVQVWGYYNQFYYEIPSWAMFTFLDAMPTNIPNGASFVAKPNAQRTQKAINCAQAYTGRYMPPGWTVFYESQFMWRLDANPEITAFTHVYSWPGAGPWRTIFGQTRLSSSQIAIFPAGYYNWDNLFVSMAHELGHANGIGFTEASHDALEQEAREALDDFKADNGAKCGGPP